jgi:hypothetical protein
MNDKEKLTVDFWQTSEGRKVKDREAYRSLTALFWHSYDGKFVDVKLVDSGFEVDILTELWWFNVSMRPICKDGYKALEIMKQTNMKVSVVFHRGVECCFGSIGICPDGSIGCLSFDMEFELKRKTI